jgi:hypothetical protein
MSAPGSEKQLTALRHMLTGNGADYMSVVRSLDHDEPRDFLILVSAAFIEAVDHRFASAELPTAVIEWVGALRSASQTAAREVDPATAEQVILLTLGYIEETALSDKQIRDGELLLLPLLVAERHLDSAGIDDFLAAARKLAES